MAHLWLPVHPTGDQDAPLFNGKIFGLEQKTAILRRTFERPPPAYGEAILNPFYRHGVFCREP
jgi:hypothetical protein